MWLAGIKQRDDHKEGIDSMETKDKITFEISGNDLKNVKKFRKQHKDCFKGMACDQFDYSFTPSGLGLAITVKCSCGQELMLGNFMDFDSGEYDEVENRVLTAEDHKNKKFEDAVQRILQMKNPQLFRIGFRKDQNFDMIYMISAYGIASVADERIGKCILWLCDRGKHGEEIDNYKDLSEEEKIEAFYKYFEDHVREEVLKYDCKNKRLLEALGIKTE